MAQHDYDIANQSFPAFRTDLNNVLGAINSSNSGSSRPSSAVNGTIWLDTTNATTPTLKLYDGSDDISLATFDYSANTVNWLDSTVSADLVNDLSPQLGGMLDVNGNAIGNGTEELIKFSETSSAVNEITVTNSATGNAPEISATGGDTNIDFKLTPKGTGKLVLDGLNFPTADGSADQVLKTDGSGTLSFADAGGGGYESVQVFTTSGTYTKPAGIKKIRVIVTGGGGGGGPCPSGYVNGAGQGGGAGGTAIKTIDATSITTETVTVGAGGSAESGGSTSSFGSHCSGSGGGGGANADSIANPPGGGGAGASGGDLNLSGNPGGGGSKGTVPNSRTGGFGGSSYLGRGGFGSCGNSGGGGLYGGGGGGASTNQPPTNRGGGAGGSGIVVVEEYK
jgi:hypothetical protein